jgi:hypothetical protein
MVDTFIGFVELAVVVGLVMRWRLRRRNPSTRARPKTMPQGNPVSATGADVDASVGGWILGHQIASNHSGFPGDPLPSGHLGSPANLAFWSGTSEPEEDDTEGNDDCW